MPAEPCHSLADPRRSGKVEGGLPGRTALEGELVRLWEECLQVRPEHIHANFFALGGDASAASGMLEELERRLGLEVSPADLLQAPTVEQLADLVRRRLRASPRAQLVELQKGSSSTPPLFFVHGDLADGGFYCRNLARHLGDAQGFVALQPHGWEEPFLVPGSIEEIAADNVRAMLDLQPEGPYALGGYCNGATAAFEMAQQLQAQGKRVECVIIVAAVPRLRPRRYSAAALLAALPKRRLAARSLDFRGVPRERRFRPLERAYDKLARRYVMRPFAGRLLVIEAASDMYVHSVMTALNGPSPLLRLILGRALRKLGFESLARTILGPALGRVQGTLKRRKLPRLALRVLLGEKPVYPDWRALGTEVTIEQLPGDHHSILHREIQRLAGCISQHLSRRARREYRLDTSGPR